MTNSAFHKFSHPILRSESFTKLNVQRTEFSYGLSPAVKISSATRVSGLMEDQIFLHCHFNRCQSDSTGGAIQSEAAVNVIFCVFQHCSASSGGAIACKGSMVSNFSTYVHVGGIHAFGIFDLDDGGDVFNLDSNVFAQSTNMRSSFNKYGCINVHFVSNNFTAIEADTLCGFELGRCSPNITFCVFENLRTRVRCGALSFWQCYGFDVSVVIKDVTVGGNSETTNIMSWLDGSDQTGIFRKCYVMNVQAKRGKILYCQDSTQIVVSECCFSVKREDVTNDLVRVILENSNKYDVKSSTRVAKMTGGASYMHMKGARRMVDLDPLFGIFSVVSLVVLVCMFAGAVHLSSL